MDKVRISRSSSSGIDIYIGGIVIVDCYFVNSVGNTLLLPIYCNLHSPMEWANLNFTLASPEFLTSTANLSTAFVSRQLSTSSKPCISYHSSNILLSFKSAYSAVTITIERVGLVSEAVTVTTGVIVKVPELMQIVTVVSTTVTTAALVSAEEAVMVTTAGLDAEEAVMVTTLGLGAGEAVTVTTWMLVEDGAKAVLIWIVLVCVLAMVANTIVVEVLELLLLLLMTMLLDNSRVVSACLLVESFRAGARSSSAGLLERRRSPARLSVMSLKGLDSSSGSVLSPLGCTGAAETTAAAGKRRKQVLMCIFDFWYAGWLIRRLVSRLR